MPHDNGVAILAEFAHIQFQHGVELLGVELEEKQSATDRRVAVRVIRTDEALMIARSVWRILGLGASTKDIPGA
ncbi:MAG: hypothetical protein ACREJN_13060 [Nitrospiraceae bacterium]